jgi:hypothetical protein
LSSGVTAWSFETNCVLYCLTNEHAFSACDDTCLRVFDFGHSQLLPALFCVPSSSSVVARLHASHYPPLNESLLLIFARLIHSSSVESILGFLLSLGQISVQEKKLVPVKKNVTDKYTSSFKTELVPTTVDALPYLLSKWITSQTEIHAKYPSKVMHLALAKLLTYLFTNVAGVEALRNMECQGYVIVEPTKKGAPSKRNTRSQTAASTSSSSHEPQYTKVPLCSKLLQLFVREWKEYDDKNQSELKRHMKRAKKLAKEAGADGDDDEDADDDFEDEDDEFDDDEDDFSDENDEDFVNQMKAKVAGGGAGASPFAAAEDYADFGGPQSKNKLMTLSDMLDYHTGDLDDLDGEMEEEVFPESLTDPLNQIELGSFLQNYLKEFAAANGGAFLQEAARWLDDQDKKTLQDALIARAAGAPPMQQ